MRTMSIAILALCLLGCGGITEEVSFEMMVPDSLKLHMHAYAADLVKAATPNQSDEDPEDWIATAHRIAHDTYSSPQIGIRFTEKGNMGIYVRSSFIPYGALDERRQKKCREFIQNN